MNELNVGDKVMMIEDELHAEHPEYYPTKGSIGVVVQYSLRDGIALIDWGQDSGVNLNEHDEYAWWCSVKRLEKVNTNAQVNTQKEVCNMSKFNVGDKVVFMNAEKHEELSEFYPAVGSIGVIKEVRDSDGNIMVNWGEAEGIVVHPNGMKAWWCDEKDIKPCDAERKCTDNEVWEMLKPKMERIVTILADVDNFHDEVKKIVVDAYRSGYGRAMKGRPFRIKPKNTVKN